MNFGVWRVGDLAFMIFTWFSQLIAHLLLADMDFGGYELWRLRKKLLRL